MQITEIIVSAGGTTGEDFETATKELQAKAEGMVEDHKQNMLKSLCDLETMTRRQQEIASLESGIRKAQSRLDDIRKEYPSLKGQEQEEIPFGVGYDDKIRFWQFAHHF